MKKAIARSVFLLLTIALLASCGKSDSSSTVGMLLGTWKLIKTNNTNPFVGSPGYLNGNYIITFNTDGTGTESQTENNTTYTYTYNFTWLVQNNTNLKVVTTNATGTIGTKSSIDGTSNITLISTTNMTIVHNNTPVADTFSYVRLN